jgi:hypothetical protein
MMGHRVTSRVSPDELPQADPETVERYRAFIERAQEQQGALYEFIVAHFPLSVRPIRPQPRRWRMPRRIRRR